MKNPRISHLSVLIVQVNITSGSGSRNGQPSKIRNLSWPKIPSTVIHWEKYKLLIDGSYRRKKKKKVKSIDLSLFVCLFAFVRDYL